MAAEMAVAAAYLWAGSLLAWARAGAWIGAVGLLVIATLDHTLQ